MGHSVATKIKSIWIIEDCIANDISSVLILEDDALLHPDFGQQVRQFLGAPSGLAVYLSGWSAH